jgi:hypothetical protein
VPQEKMPATSGRVRMPHNNRVSTAGALHTSSIWKQTIGHDPYANKEADAEREAMRAKTAEQAKGLLELARHRNLANSSTSMVGGSKVAGGDDFARKMFLGLKPKKRRRDTDDCNGVDAATMGDNKIHLNELGESSSSEEEFIEVEVEEGHTDSSSSAQKETSRRHKKRSSIMSKKKKKKGSSKKKKHRYDSSSGAEDSKRRRKKHRSKEKRREKKRKRSDSSSSSSD